MNALEAIGVFALILMVAAVLVGFILWLAQR